jgi:hypothetical protein
MLAIKRSWVQKFSVAILVSLVTTHAAAAYNLAYCQSVANTLNIHWRATAGSSAPCTGIEFTDGTLADAADGTIAMTGTGVSNNTCIGTAAYAFTQTSNLTQLIGSDTASNVPMTLTRGPGEQCFVGTWTLGADVYEAHIWGGAFPSVATGVPGLGTPALLLLAALILGIGGFITVRKSSR